MNREWADMNKKMQVLIKKRETFDEGVELLLKLREDLFSAVREVFEKYPSSSFSEMPFAGADGYHSKTIAYSVWHIFRIEDIVAHELILHDKEVLFSGNYLEKTSSPIKTTGNELKGSEIAEFSASLDFNELINYAEAVKNSTDEMLRSLKFEDLKRHSGDEDRKNLEATGCVSTDEDAFWLIDYWCGKDIRGLIQMPFSRHWIMHIEALLRIKNKLFKES